MNIALIQSNPIVGDIPNIRKRMLFDISQAADSGNDIVIFPELATTGYPPRDLLYRPRFLAAQQKTVDAIADHCATKHPNITAVFGCVQMNPSKVGRPIMNAVAVIQNTRPRFRFKAMLPNYDVFDENRYFEPALDSTDNFFVFKVDGVNWGAVICEEMWFNRTKFYRRNPVKILAEMGAEWIASINASPFVAGKAKERLDMCREHCLTHDIGMACAFQVGGNDEVVFDGNSFVMNKRGKVVYTLPAFKEAAGGTNADPPSLADEPVTTKPEETRLAAIMGLRDYAVKQGIERLFLNMSGGVDSALAGYYAVETGLPVIAFSLPTKFNEQDTITDSAKQCEVLAIRYAVVPIEEILKDYRLAMNLCIVDMHSRYGDMILRGYSKFWKKNPDGSLSSKSVKSFPMFEDSGVPDENLQPRIRGNWIMAWANLCNGLVVGTGNRSEMAVGYTTLYGDMASGFNVLKDISKPEVWQQCRLANALAGHEVILNSIIERAPSAGLRPNQKDTDSLPPYELLDQIEQQYTSEMLDPLDIILFLKPTYPPERNLVDDVVNICRRVDGNEFKRRQAPLGEKNTNRDLGKGRQVPVVQAYTKVWMQDIIDAQAEGII